MKDRRKKIRNELRVIGSRCGGLTPEAVVEFARDPRTALHGEFEWNDGAAAHQHRLQQARQVIQVFVTVLDNGAGKAKPMRVFVSVKRSGKSRVYEQTEQVVTDAQRRTELLSTTIARIEGIITSYPLVELDPVQRAVERVKSKLGITEIAA